MRQQDIAQNLDEISVSRLCCPVCLEYFKVLKDDVHINAILPGSHPNLYAVELPSCTPTHIVKAMVERFRHYLGNELTVLAISNRVTPTPLSGASTNQKRHQLTLQTTQFERKSAEEKGTKDIDILQLERRVKALEDTSQTDPAQLELRLEKIEECAEKYEEMADLLQPQLLIQQEELQEVRVRYIGKLSPFQATRSMMSIV